MSSIIGIPHPADCDLGIDFQVHKLSNNDSDKIHPMSTHPMDLPLSDILRPTYAVINLTQLKKNVQAIRAAVSPARVLVMLKANAYGHGVTGVAPYIEPYVDYIGVALLEEGVYLRELGITKPILVAGGVLPEQVPYFLKYNLTMTASSPEHLDLASSVSKGSNVPIKVHLKIDTGMERVGVRYYEAESFLEASLHVKNVDVEGIYTHFSNSEDPHLVEARQQMDRFIDVLGYYEKRSLPKPRICHAANSAAVCNFPESFLDMVRPGIMFYGVYPDKGVKRDIHVRPAITWKSRVSYSKITRAGQSVSYGSLWKSDHPVRIVTVPCGYADGYFRRMTNNARVVVNGKKYPQVGRICMDQFMVNLEDSEASAGDEVVLLGRSESGETILAEDLAEWAGTNAYEVLTNIHERVPRVYIEEDK